MARSIQTELGEHEIVEGAGPDRRDGPARRLFAPVFASVFASVFALLFGALWALLVAVATNRLLRACAAWLRGLALRLLAWLWKWVLLTSEALYVHFGRPITIGLTGTSFLWLVLSPDTNPLYRGVNWASDVDCMAMNIYHEARGEPELGKLAVGHVVMNRVMDSRFPGTVCGVVMQGGSKPSRGCQFSWWCDGRDDRPIHQPSWVDSHQIASMIFSGSSKDPTGGALWYHADYVSPRWRQTLVPGPKIGQHHFYRAPDKR